MYKVALKPRVREVHVKILLFLYLRLIVLRYPILSKNSYPKSNFKVSNIIL